MIDPPAQADLEGIVATEMPPALARMLVRDNRPCMVVVNELRAILAPLLDDPMHGEPSSCVFCCASEYGQDPETFATVRADPVEHDPECPTREPRRSRLLGR